MRKAPLHQHWHPFSKEISPSDQHYPSKSTLPKVFQSLSHFAPAKCWHYSPSSFFLRYFHADIHFPTPRPKRKTKPLFDCISPQRNATKPQTQTIKKTTRNSMWLQNLLFKRTFLQSRRSTVKRGLRQQLHACRVWRFAGDGLGPEIRGRPAGLPVSSSSRSRKAQN